MLLWCMLGAGLAGAVVLDARRVRDGGVAGSSCVSATEGDGNGRRLISEELTEAFQAQSVDETTEEEEELEMRSLRQLQTEPKQKPTTTMTPWHVAPSDCGDEASFRMAEGAKDGPFRDLMVSGKTLYKLERPDLLRKIREAVTIIEDHGLMNSSTYCSLFDSCPYSKWNGTRPLSKHSDTFFVCPKYQHVLASSMLAGVNANMLPGQLFEQKDENVFCQLAEYVKDVLEHHVMPSGGLNGLKCIVPEVSINRQGKGAYTKPHIHVDDFWGGQFYLDTPEDTKFCYDSKNTLGGKKRFFDRLPQFVEDFKKPQYVSPRAGDILLVPVAWMRHWVPPIQGDDLRTSIAFSLKCL